MQNRRSTTRTNTVLKVLLILSAGLVGACGHEESPTENAPTTTGSPNDGVTPITVTPPPPGTAPPANPTITLVSPADNANYLQGTDIPLSANASDSDGTIQQVAFYENGDLLGTDTSSPYNFNWIDAPIGSHDIHAVAFDNDGHSAESAIHRIFVNQDSDPANSGTLSVYPVNQEIRDQLKSDRFAVRLSQNGSTQSSFVYQSDNNADPSWSGTRDYMQTANHWTTFSFDGSVDVEASRLDGNTVHTCIVRPTALNIQVRIKGNTCRFTLEQPAKVSVEIDENESISADINQIGQITKQIVKHPLFVFADPLETAPPKASDPGVLYFGPGIHRIGKQYPLANDTQVYISGGAYVIGTFISAQPNPSNITISGRGILSGIELTETATEHDQWRNHSIDFSSGSHGRELKIEGITITDPLRSCILSYNPINIQNVKLFSWNHRNDGITAGDNSLVEDNFIKAQDDNIKLYYSNQIIRRNVIWQQVSGAVFKFAWNLAGTAQGNQVTDIDIIHSDVFTDYAPGETDRPDMYSTNAIFSAMGFQKDAAFQNNSFNRIRIEEKNILRLMSLRMASNHSGISGSTVWGDQDPTASKLIDNLTFNNIQLAGLPYKQSTLYGNAGGKIRNLSFANLSIKGTVVASKAALSSRIDGIGLLIDGDVSNITFSY
jgi:hypothetical protein